MSTKTITALDEARSLAAHGFAVFPCVKVWDEEKGKDIVRPKFSGYPDFAATSPEEVDEAGFEDGDLVAVLAGASLEHGVIFVDIDDKEGSPRSGFTSLENANADLPDTYHYVSRSGRGEHHWYLAPPDVEVTQGNNVKDNDGEKMHAVDLKAGRAGYVLWPGGLMREAPRLSQAPSWAVKRKVHRATEDMTLEDWVNGGLLPNADPEQPLTKAEKRWLKDLFPLHGVSNGDLYEKVKTVVGTSISGHGRYTKFMYAQERYTRHYASYAPQFQRAWAKCVAEVEAEVNTIFSGEATERYQEVKTYPDDNDDVFEDIGAILRGELTPAKADVGLRSDGQYLLYSGKVSVFVGDPESGKTLIAASIAADMLRAGKKVMFVDLDHNGAREIIYKLQSFGVDPHTLADRDHFRFAGRGVESSEDVLHIVKVAQKFKPHLVIIDSLGELIPLFGGDSNSADDYSSLHRAVPARIAATGAAVAMIDHYAKGSESRAFGATGSGAKKRAIDGVLYEVRRKALFSPSGRGEAELYILKDREGDVRDHSPRPRTGNKQLAATFILDHTQTPSKRLLEAPGEAPGELSIDMSDTRSKDLQALLKKKVIPTTKNDIMNVMGWGTVRALTALRELNEYQEEKEV